MHIFIRFSPSNKCLEFMLFKIEFAFENMKYRQSGFRLVNILTIFDEVCEEVRSEGKSEGILGLGGCGAALK